MIVVDPMTMATGSRLGPGSAGIGYHVVRVAGENHRKIGAGIAVVRLQGTAG